MKAIICRETLWDDPAPLSTNYLARALVRRGWDVLWLTRPWHPYSLLRPQWRDSRRAKLRQWSAGGKMSDADRVRSYAFGTLLPYRRAPLLGSAWAGRHSLDFGFPAVRPTLRRLGFDRPDLLLVSDLAQAGIVGLVAGRRTILQVTDDYSGFARSPSSVIDLEGWAAGRVDCVVTPRRNLAALLMQRHHLREERILVLPHGVEETILDSDPPPADYMRIPEPRVVFVGALQEWLDWDLLEETARRCPGISFVLVGGAPPGDASVPQRMRRLQGIPNVHLLGAKPHGEAMACLAAADAAIIPNRAGGGPAGGTNGAASRKNRSAAPMKLMEYLAFGLPIVSTIDYRSDLPAVPEIPFHLAEGPALFARAVAEAVAASRHGRASLRQAGRAFANDNSWTLRVDRLLQRLDLEGA